jgi:hypothetical protein
VSARCCAPLRARCERRAAMDCAAMRDASAAMRAACEWRRSAGGLRSLQQQHACWARVGGRCGCCSACVVVSAAGWRRDAVRRRAAAP